MSAPGRKTREGQGQTGAWLVRGAEPRTVFARAGIVRPESKQAITELKSLGVDSIMLTGDAHGVAQAVSEELGITEYFAEVLPNQKSEKIEELQSRGLAVALVGEGVNDDPALVVAELGIALGAATEVRGEAAETVRGSTALRAVV